MKSIKKDIYSIKNYEWNINCKGATDAKKKKKVTS